MDAMLHALGGILLRAIPTFLLVIVLHFYLKSVFFKPLAGVLRQRYDLTEGARKLAQKSLEEAAAKAAHYEASLRAAKTQLYRAQEQLNKQMQERESAAVAEARATGEATVKAAKAQLASDVAELKTQLASQSDVLAAKIVESILRRSAA
jgi:F-type H+-transporting ATPase subunit b